jgi:hypothetical protein
MPKRNSHEQKLTGTAAHGMVVFELETYFAIRSL